ncbi:hypothetical protein [Streptomyces sp. UG1]|uniref:hypothetical protein n=1 Tax=Streptomyces sp. UG1 TaxID=3417652 RepID=UPI003CF0963A
MIRIILAALGVALLASVVLLFRRIKEIEQRQAEAGRRLDEMVRQFTLVYVEIYRELLNVQRHLSSRSLPAPGPPRRAAANGDNRPEQEPSPPPAKQPLRTKKHISLLPGGIAALALTFAAWLREALQTHRGYVVGTAIGATAAAGATATLLVITPWEDRADLQPPSSAPTPTATVTQPLPIYTQPPTPPPSSPLPSTSPSPSASTIEPSPSATASISESPSISQEPTASVVTVGPATATPGSPQPTPGGGGTPPDEPGTGELPSAEQPPAGEEPPPSSAPSAPPSETPAGSGLCASVTASPVLDAGICLPAPGGG